jgi:CDP-paratose 2-epimerase
MRILITGGAGFVGSSLAKYFQESGAEVVVLDNLKRRGSERNLTEFRKRGISFFHGDIRCPSDLEDLPGNFDFFLEASAEPSVHAGNTGSPRYVLDTNLGGTIHCLEFSRKRAKGLIFLSTSRVYSIAPLLALPLDESTTRMELKKTGLGFSNSGINEDFSTQSARSFYGASKLASEMLIQEYGNSYGMNAIINRCGVIAGAGQFGKLDQGVFTLWIANHHYQKPLKYTGFGGTGKQVRDLLHPRDLFSLLKMQMEKLSRYQGDIFNVGGGTQISTSLFEWSKFAAEATGKSLQIESVKETAAVDIPFYISDFQKAASHFQWQPKVNAREIAQDIANWIRENETELRNIF